MSLNLRDNIKVAVDSIKSNKLRAIITMLIIAIGIMALVGIFTAIDAIKNGINSNFTDMGANTFTIRNGEYGVRVGKRGRKAKRYEPISFKDAMRFKWLKPQGVYGYFACQADGDDLMVAEVV